MTTRPSPWLRNLLIFSLLACMNSGYAMSWFHSEPPKRKQTAMAFKWIKPGDPKYKFKMCPDAKTLTKDPKSLIWSAPGNWKSYSASFVDNIERFLGAQWHGVQVGRIVCVYAGRKASSFPVSIQRNNLVRTPRIIGWKMKKSNAYVCHSRNVRKCPFIEKSYDDGFKSEEELRQIFRDIKQ